MALNSITRTITIWYLIISDSDQSGVVTVKTNYIYIGIGIVAGFGLLIVILILTVIHLARRNRKGHGMCLTRAIKLT